MSGARRRSILRRDAGYGIMRKQQLNEMDRTYR